MRKLLLVGTATLLLSAEAAAQQGNLPKPVQKLPAYPPIICVATNWAFESCEDRQTPLPQPNPLRAFGRAIESPPRLKTVLYDEPGGMIAEHWQRWMKLAGSGDDAEIRGACVSACTLIMAHIPTDRLCFGENASLQFHPSRDPKTGEPDVSNALGSTQWMINQYPQDIRLWIKNKGGWEKMALGQMWTLDASELWRMGYRKCEPEELPVPMTITKSAKMRMGDEKGILSRSYYAAPGNRDENGRVPRAAVGDVAVGNLYAATTVSVRISTPAGTST